MEETSRDFDERKAGFMKEYEGIVSKYSIDTMAVPNFVPNDRGTWEIAISVVVADLKGKPVRSPFVSYDGAS